MKVTRIDLDGTRSPSGLVAGILKIESDLPIPVPIEELAAQLDIVSIGELVTEGFEAALITDRLKAQGAILVAKGRSHHRRRFSIAHELGHFLIPAHLPPPGEAFQCKAADMRMGWSREQDRHQRMEAEANRFAAQILMPPPLLRIEIGKERAPEIESILRLARHFDVSREAMARTYVEAHREALAVVIMRNGKVLRSYRSKHFPWITASGGQPTSVGSIWHRAPPMVGEITDVEKCATEAWIGERDDRNIEMLTEQVLTQRDGFSMILLHAHLRDDEEEEARIRPADDWRPRF